MAWLNAVPKPDPRLKDRLGDDEKRSQRSRLDLMGGVKNPPPMPPNPLPRMIELLIEIGLTEAAGMGSAPLSWREISAWVDRTGVQLLPWESRLLRSLSVAYLAESHRATAHNSAAPWRAPLTAREIAHELDQLAAVLG